MWWVRQTPTPCHMSRFSLGSSFENPKPPTQKRCFGHANVAAQPTGGGADRGELGGVVQQRLAQHGVDVVLVRVYELVQVACARARSKDYVIGFRPLTP